MDETAEPEVWGGGCECWVTPEHMWTTHYGATEPGSQIEYNPECPKHGDRDRGCIECGDHRGWRVEPDWNTGEAVQVQCRTCTEHTCPPGPPEPTR